MPTLPLFPLGETLLPGRRLPLQLFEERYVALLQHLIDSDGEEIGFGVVSIRHGYEVGDRVNELHTIGCLAVLDRVVQVSGGLYLVLTHGTERFRLDGIDDEAGTPWATGKVTWLHDVPGEPDAVARQVEAVTAAVGTHTRAVGSEVAEPPSDPADVAWWAAEALELERHDRQRLLELPEVVARLGLVRRLAQRETGLAARLGVVGGPMAAPPSLN